VSKGLISKNQHDFIYKHSPITNLLKCTHDFLFSDFASRNLHVFRQAYITYIRPLLEYVSDVWSPHLIMHDNSVDRVQRHFTKRITELRDLSYR